MSLDNYSDLKLAVQRWLHRVGETGLDDRVEEFIVLTEDKLNLELDTLTMEVTIPLTLTDQTIDLPEDYRGLRSLIVPGNPNHRIEFRSPASFWGTWFSSEAGLPKFYTIQGAQEGASSEYSISFGPWRSLDQSGAPQTVVLLYRKKYPHLSDTNTTNWIVKNARGLLLYGALTEASGYFKKPVAESLTWATHYDSLMAKVHSSDRLQRVPEDGGAMVPYGVGIA